MEDFSRCEACDNDPEECARLIADEFLESLEAGVYRYKKCTKQIDNPNGYSMGYLEENLPEILGDALDNMSNDEKLQFIKGDPRSGYEELQRSLRDRDGELLWAIIKPVIDEALEGPEWKCLRLKERISPDKQPEEPKIL